MSNRLLVITTVIIALVISGCFGGGGSSSTRSRLPKEEPTIKSNAELKIVFDKEIENLPTIVQTTDGRGEIRPSTGITMEYELNGKTIKIRVPVKAGVNGYFDGTVGVDDWNTEVFKYDPVRKRAVHTLGCVITVKQTLQDRDSPYKFYNIEGEGECKDPLINQAHPDEKPVYIKKIFYFKGEAMEVEDF